MTESRMILPIASPFDEPAVPLQIASRFDWTADTAPITTPVTAPKDAKNVVVKGAGDTKSAVMAAAKKETTKKP